MARPVQALIPGVQGRILAVLAGTTAELNLRTVAELAGVSIAQASRVLPELVALGVVERRDVPPSALFRWVPEHVAARAIGLLRDARQVIFDDMASHAGEIEPPPVSVVVFGSVATGTAEASSDLDVLVVRPSGVSVDDDRWRDSLDRWVGRVRRSSGNAVQLLEESEPDARRRLRGSTPLWGDIRREGVAVFGLSCDDLARRV